MASRLLGDAGRARPALRDAQEAASGLPATDPGLSTWSCPRPRQLPVTLGRILYHPRAVMLDARPHEALEPVLRIVQEATRLATGKDGRLYHEPWISHITVAYSNMARPAAPVIEALGRELPRRDVTISSISLISQAPEHLLTWHPVTDVHFGS